LAGTRRYQAQFTDQKSYQPEYELELAEELGEDVYDLIRMGKYGRALDLRRTLAHVHLTGRVANLVYSMDATNTDFYAYQFKPVLSFLESPSNGLLIADEVGLGKTIEAGLIWTELRARYDARRLLVVCPAMLREKWKYELQERFAVDADILSAEELRSELARPRTEIPDGKGIVCSLQGLRPPPYWWYDRDQVSGSRADLARFLNDSSDADPLIDLLIVDEAHYLRNPETQTARLGRLLRDVSESAILLSATPINLRDEDLFHLLNLVDPDTFDVKEIFPQVLQANAPLQKARNLLLAPNADREEVRGRLEEARQHPILQANRQLRQLLDQEFDEFDMGTEVGRVALADRIDRINLLRHAITRTRKSEVTEWRVVRDPHVQFVPMDESGTEAALYRDVTEAIRDYAITADVSEGFLLATPQRQISSCMYAAVKSWRDRYADVDEAIYEDLGQVTEGDVDISPLIRHLNDTVARSVDLDMLWQCDSKYHRFKSVIYEYLGAHPEEKIIVFSYFRGTLDYLAKRLERDGYHPTLLYGGMRENKSDVIERFRTNLRSRVLLSSEVASEGVDLQFSRVVINYDLPWNPMKVEQRIGRVDRLGQEADKISVWSLLYADTIDQRIYQRLCERLNIFEHALGGMEAILGEEIAGLTADLLRQRLTPEQEAKRIEQTALAIERKRNDQEQLEAEASQLIAHGGYITQQVRAAHDFKRRITSGDLQAYVKDYLDRYVTGFEFRQVDSEPDQFLIRLPSSVTAKLQDYIRRHRISMRTRLPLGEEVRCVFDNKVQHPKDKVERISQFHPLTRYISSDLADRDEVLYPLVAVRVPPSALSTDFRGVVAFSIERWRFEGLRVEEEIRARATPIEKDRALSSEESWELAHTARTEGSDWLDHPGINEAEPILAALEICEATLESDYRRAATQRENENADRVSLQLQSARKHRDRQLEIRNTVLEEHRRGGRDNLVRATQGQLEKIQRRFEQQEQRLNDRSALRHSHDGVCWGVAWID